VKEKSKRPLIANINDDDLAEFIAKHLFERSRFYNQAQLTLNIDDLPVERVVQEICNDLDEYNL
jgi:shikimate kinase